VAHPFWHICDTLSQMTDSTNLTNDRYGYSCYALVFPTTKELEAKVAAIERASGMTRAKIPAHITVKGTFHEIPDLVKVRNIARKVIAGTRRFQIPFEGAERAFSKDVRSAGLQVKATPEMQRLHDDLVSAHRRVVTTVYPDDPYRPHLTVYQEATEKDEPAARALFEGTDLGPGFEAAAIDLMGRRGPAYGGRWARIERFSLG
jgi:2'-5' RNA ligase